MDERERHELRASILADVGEMLVADFAGERWTRLLAETARDEHGEPVLAEVSIEGWDGEDDELEAALTSDRALASVPALAKAIEALCGLDDVDFDRALGGTFAHGPSGMQFFAGCVPSPSDRLSTQLDAVRGFLESWQQRATHVPKGARYEVDLERGEVTFYAPGSTLPAARAEATVLATFDPTSATFAWAKQNPNLSAEGRRRATELVDGMLERDAWELRETAFQIDREGAELVAGWVAQSREQHGLVALEGAGGIIFVTVGAIRAQAAVH